MLPGDNRAYLTHPYFSCCNIWIQLLSEDPSFILVGESFRGKILAIGMHARLFNISSDRKYILDPRSHMKLKSLMFSYGFCASHWPSYNFYLYFIHFSYTPILQCSLYFFQALKFSHFFTYSLSKIELCLNH